jgi:hypothetical protein
VLKFYEVHQVIEREFSKLADPEQALFDKGQKILLQQYIDLRARFGNDSTDQFKYSILELLNSFFKSLASPQQIIVRNWYSYQLTCIDNKLLPSLKLAQFIKENDLQNSLAVSSDGKSFMLLFDDEKSAKKINDRFRKKHPFVKYELIEVNKQ